VAGAVAQAAAVLVVEVATGVVAWLYFVIPTLLLLLSAQV